MPFLTEVHFQNYRSFLDAKCRLLPDKTETPVTVILGANNAGKSNLLRGLQIATSGVIAGAQVLEPFHAEHFRRPDMRSKPQEIMCRGVGGKSQPLIGEPGEVSVFNGGPGKDGGANNNLFTTLPMLFRLDASKVGGSETDQAAPFVHQDGEGVTRVLQLMSLKHRKAFSAVEAAFVEYVPEIEELTFERADQGKWFLMVKERGFQDPVALSELSEGTRTVLALLTILHQPNRPELILIEDIEHAIHPRGLKPLVETMRRISKEHGVQIIFTTQSPYVLDAFQDPEHWDSVVIVEKREGVSTLTNAKERLVALGYEREMDKVPLGDLWYSGLLGGVAGPNELWDEKEPKTTST